MVRRLFAGVKPSGEEISAEDRLDPREELGDCKLDDDDEGIDSDKEVSCGAGSTQ